MTDQTLNLRTPWTKGINPGVDAAVQSLVSEIKDRHKAGEETNLTQIQKDKLARDFKNAEQGRGYAGKYMRALAKAMHLECPDAAVVIAPMKRWNRAAEKISIADRNLHDLGRGRIYIKTPKDIQKFYKLLNGKNAEGHIPGATHNASIIPGSISNYLENPRKSGFAGALLFDLEVDLGKNRFGALEAQIMPEDYQDVYNQSHRLYDMIRIFQEIPENFRTRDHNYILENLVRANAALFDEFSMRTGFDVLRKEPIHVVTEEEYEMGFDVLDKIWTELNRGRSNKEPWIKETQDALSFAKTSLANLEIAGRRKQKLHEPVIELVNA